MNFKEIHDLAEGLVKNKGEGPYKPTNNSEVEVYTLYVLKEILSKLYDIEVEIANFRQESRR